MNELLLAAAARLRDKAQQYLAGIAPEHRNYRHTVSIDLDDLLRLLDTFELAVKFESGMSPKLNAEIGDAIRRDGFNPGNGLTIIQDADFDIVELLNDAADQFERDIPEGDVLEGRKALAAKYRAIAERIGGPQL